MITEPCFVAYLMMFSHSWRCSHAFLTSMSFNRARVPMVRWSFAGFWKMLSSTPWSYILDDTDKSILKLSWKKCFSCLESMCNDVSCWENSLKETSTAPVNTAATLLLEISKILPEFWDDLKGTTGSVWRAAFSGNYQPEPQLLWALRTRQLCGNLW